LSDREVQPFDKGRVQFRGVLGISKHLLQSPVSTDYCSVLDLHNTIVATGFDDLPVQTRGSKDTADDLRIKGESVRGNQRDTFEIRSAEDIPEDGEGVSIASSSHDCRRPKPRPDLDRGEDPNGLFLVVDDRTDLIRLKLCDRDSIDSSIVEAATRAGSFLEPAMNGIPGDLLYPSNRGLVQALDAEGGDLIEGRATMLESMVWRTGVRAECLPTTSAPVSTALP
jgi:hypothetical protein